ncbi:MAG: hypothetical protein HZA08_05095 [Nitrospirae bacterium]|nr:hypothetical protein [Nitrospirota bacterium]
MSDSKVNHLSHIPIHREIHSHILPFFAASSIVIMIAVLLTGCGTSPGNTDSGTANNNPNSIGPDGGTVTSSDGKVKIVIPSGALNKDTDITFASVNNQPSGNIGIAYEVNPDGTIFNKPVTISITYDEASLPSGVSESGIKLGTVTNNKWEVITDSIVNTASNTISGSITHLSTYGIVEVTSGSVPAAPANIAATAGDGKATISWDAVSGATSYNIYWSTTSGVTKTTGTKISGVTTPYSHTGRTNGITYYYVVTAVNGYGESSESVQVSAKPVVIADTVLWGLGSVNGDIYQTSKPVYIQNHGYVRNVAQVAGGYSHILVLFNDGTLAGWGSNQYGQIGVSNYSGGLDIIAHDVISIAAGYYHTVFLKRDGTVWASGLNSYGQLGDGTLKNKSIPVQIASGVLSVSASDYATSILKQDGTLWRTDVIINPTPGQHGQFSQQASNVKVIPVYSYKPIYVTSADVLVDAGNVVGYNVSALTATSQNVYYITKGGTLYGYGENYSGQLGNGTNVGTTIPIVIANSISGVGASSNMAWFIDNNGDLYGTGDNRWGTFNPDTNSYRYVWTPVLISHSVKAIFSSAPDSYVVFFLKDY